MEEKLHYYSFAFQHVDGREVITASVYIGYPRKFISISQIADAKMAAFKGIDLDAPGKSVLLSCCYLGKMTEKEMNGGSSAHDD